MAVPVTLQRDFSLGTKRDFPRNAMPKGSVWNSTDMLPNLGAPLRERGGYSYASNDISAAKATASYVIGGIYAPYSAGQTNIAIDEDGELYKIASNGTVTDVAAAVTVAQNPVFHRDKVIVPASGGSTAPKKVTNAAGTLTVAALGGSPPNGQYAVVFKDYACLANTSAQPQRVYFSDPGDPETWDTTNSYWDFSFTITGLAPMRTALLVFGDSYVSRLLGSTPPPNSDFFANDPMFSVGCSDARSIAVLGDRVVFASGDGIYMTDGSADPVNLAEACGMLSYWQDTLASYDKSSWTIAGKFYRGNYWVTVMSGSTFKLSAMIDIRRARWWPMTNIDAVSMWEAQGTVDELYFGRRGAARVGKLSSLFSPASGVKNDADGTAVTGTVESPYYEGDFGAKTWRQTHIDYELTDFASDNPTVTVSYIKTPEATSYTAISSTLGESTTKTTKKRALNLNADGLALKLARSSAGDFKVYGLEAEVQPREKSRRAA